MHIYNAADLAAIVPSVGKDEEIKGLKQDSEDLNLVRCRKNLASQQEWKTYKLIFDLLHHQTSAEIQLDDIEQWQTRAPKLRLVLERKTESNQLQDTDQRVTAGTQQTYKRFIATRK